MSTVLRFVGAFALGGVLTAVLALVVVLQSRPDLQIWHTVELDGEYSADQPVADFSAYLELENRLFEQVGSRIRRTTSPSETISYFRYHAGSLADPARRPVDFNRTFEWANESPTSGVLLLHGMSDSPYSLRALGEALHARGAYVIGIRLPGHGTIPGELRHVDWQDMASATRLASDHLARHVPNGPLHVIGYSTGAALAIHHQLVAMEDTDWIRFDRIVLISPSIGVSSVAALAIWQDRLGRLLGLDKLQWNSIGPEYDPFKYNSFAVNGGHQVRRLTQAIQDRIGRVDRAGLLEEFPPVLAFQSVVDATVSTLAVAENLFYRLRNPGNHFVVFDINRNALVLPILSREPLGQFETLKTSAHDFAVSAVISRSHRDSQVLVRHWPANSMQAEDRELDLAWPPGVFSLSHTALPFPLDDPLYGLEPAAREGVPDYPIGRIELRGERGVIQVSPTEMLRLRSNPFFDYLQSEVLAFLGED